MESRTYQTFYWKGQDEQGLIIQGKLSALTIKGARNELLKEGITIFSIRKQPKPFFIFSKPVQAVDIAYFFRQMATMLAAGMPMIESLEMLIESTSYHIKMNLMLLDIKKQVTSGSQLSEALASYPKHFDILSVNLVKAGESSGMLEVMLKRIATYKEKNETLKKKVKKALYYPFAVLMTALAVTAIMLIYVVPTFSDLFNSFNATLPAYTQLVIEVSQITQNYWHWVLLIIFIGIILVARLRKKSFQFRYFLDTWLIKLPIIGKIIKLTIIARFARTLSIITSSGMPMISALDAVAYATGNIVYEHATLRIKTLVSNGLSLYHAINDVCVFPNFMTQMVKVGENSGNLDEMLAKAADVYEEDVDHLVDSLSSLIEPIIMITLGCLIGALVIAMYLPIFQLGSIM
ncbi:type II secretion system F family protein [Thiotrichales bacterium 19S9-12]|nr:type II secretion system F family protein [Thiotrichales bacterium 19S9-11]MCF6810836.1 type II secretion system F family protein [Thiotrichales bacterium 19S9-12]